MRVLLAPMEGVLDPLVRELLTEVNDYDLCITEFVRVVDQLLPAKVFHRLCPEYITTAVRLPEHGFACSCSGNIPNGWPKMPPAPSNWVLTALISTAVVRRKWSTAAAVARHYLKIRS